MDEDRLFAYYLIQEVHTRLMMAQDDLSQEYLNESWKTVLNEGIRLEEESRAKNEFFREDGSVFSDYKLLRESSIPRGQGYMRKTISPKFLKTMTAEEILATANGIIGEWRLTIRGEHEV